jgi:hypothetical protein
MIANQLECGVADENKMAGQADHLSRSSSSSNWMPCSPGKGAVWGLQLDQISSGIPFGNASHPAPLERWSCLHHMQIGGSPIMAVLAEPGKARQD